MILLDSSILIELFRKKDILSKSGTKNTAGLVMCAIKIGVVEV